MKVFPIVCWLLLCICILGPGLRPDSQADQAPKFNPGATTRYVLDMISENPGEKPIASAFADPKRLADWGYNGQVVDSDVEGVATFDSVSPGILPEGSKERAWAISRTKAIQQQIKTAHAAGVKCFGWMQVLVLPKAVIEKFKDGICDDHGNIDIHLPKTQQLFRAQLREVFEQLPDLDGLVIRTGEIYLQDLPYHQAGRSPGGMIQGSSVILHGPQSHIDLLTILRDEVCEQKNKTVFYRTWDFGNHFHVNPAYYLQVTNAIEPSPNLFFSIKHQAGDFHQLTPFNPTLGIGKHPQIVEVQCQREGYGKGAHPYYVGQGVIDGWEEYAWMSKPGLPHGLRDISTNPLIAGVWTWSRGGGWDGPFITNEFWCDLNAYVVAKFAEDPLRTEPEIFEEYEHHIGLTGDDIKRFRELCLLSEKAVLRGQLTTLGASIDVWWARDDTLSAPNLKDFIKKNLVEKALAEKKRSSSDVGANRIAFHADPFCRFNHAEFRGNILHLCRIKYAMIEEAWTILFYGQLGDATGHYDQAKLAAAIGAYDQLWAEWKKLKTTQPSCSTLPKDLARGDKPGIGAAVDRYRKVLSIN